MNLEKFPVGFQGFVKLSKDVDHAPQGAVITKTTRAPRCRIATKGRGSR